MKIKDLIFKIGNISFEETLEYIIKNALKKDSKKFIITINTEIVMQAKNDPKFQEVINSADLLVNDSIGVKWARGLFGVSSKKRVHGSDLVEAVAKETSGKSITIGLLGAGEGIAKKTAEVLKERYPGLKVSFAVSEWPRKLDDGKLKIESGTLKMEDRRSIHSQSSTLKNPSSIIYPQSSKYMSTDILFIAFGSPKQEKWIYENLPKIHVKVAIGVGGAFDYISGRVRRAPVWVQNLGLEWLFRLIVQPWRIKRQVKLLGFVFLVIKEKIDELI